MTIQQARPYILNFLKGFIIAAAVKFLMDEYVFDKSFEPYSLLFWSTWMALITTWLYHRQRKKAEATQMED